MTKDELKHYKVIGKRARPLLQPIYDMVLESLHISEEKISEMSGDDYEYYRSVEAAFEDGKIVAYGHIIDLLEHICPQLPE